MTPIRNCQPHSSKMHAINWGMYINGAKCKIISPSNQRVIINGDEVEHGGEFVFLGSVVPYSTKDVIRRIGLASTAFDRLRESIWKKQYPKDTPINCPYSAHSYIRIRNIDPQIGRNAQTRGFQNALTKSHPKGDAQRKAEKLVHP